MNKALFWLVFLLYIFTMLDLFVTSIGIERGIAEANPYLSVFVTNTGIETVDGLVLVFGGLIATGFAVCLAFLASKIQRIFSFEFFIAMLVLFHFVGILNWISAIR